MGIWNAADEAGKKVQDKQAMDQNKEEIKKETQDETAKALADHEEAKKNGML